ncbi:DUF2316 family protein [Bifidobacterium crudilactis]|jgi:hypothetical protein|uniref:DUF2316 family protein n=1 Tax=Bifidobacterium crudilactis TaxID=327277 RepID=UPI002F355E14
MSLNIAQRRATRAEFAKNVELLGLTPADVAAALGVDGARIEDIMALRRVRRLEDAWVLRAFLLDRANRSGVELVPFSALRGNPEDYPFLDAERIQDRLLD